MIIVWLFFLFIEAMITKIFSLNILLTQDVYDVLFLAVSFIVTIIIIAKNKLPIWVIVSLSIYMLFSYVWTIYMYFDVDYVIELFKQRDPLIFFQPQALSILSDESFEGAQFYSILVAAIYYCFGESMRIPIFINITATFFSVIYIYKTLCCWDISPSRIKVFTLFFLLLPWKLMLSLYMIREALPTMGVVLVVYYFSIWIKEKEDKRMAFALFWSVFSMLFHAGLIPILVMLILSAILYSPHTNRISIRMKSVRNIIVIIFVGCIIVAVGGERLFEKLTMVALKDEAIHAWSVKWTEQTDTGSLYLTSLQYNSISDVVIQSPIRLLYLLYSPMPWDWRGLKDIVAFMVESMFQVVMIGIVLKSFKFLAIQERDFLKILISAYLLTGLLFGVGTFESGTAMRHREKFMPLLFIAASISYDRRKKYSEMQ